MGEDFLNLLIEIEVSDLQWVFWASEMIFKFLIFFSCKLEFLSKKSGSEFSSFDGTLSEWIVILEEFSKSDSVSHHMLFNLLHKSINCPRSTEINVEIDIGGFGSRVWLIDHILKAGGISDEWQVFDVTELVSICSDT